MNIIRNAQNPMSMMQSWYNYTRLDVDAGTLQNSVKLGLKMWLDWESETKVYYEKMYKELMDIGEVASANFILSYVEDVDCELKSVEKYALHKKATSYNLSGIISEQKSMHDKYKH